MRQMHLDTCENINHLLALLRGVSRLLSQKLLRFLCQEQAGHQCDTRLPAGLKPPLPGRARSQAIPAVVGLQALCRWRTWPL